MLREFAEHQKLLDYFETTEERLNAAMFGPDANVEGLIAFLEGSVAGFLLFYPCISSFRGEMELHIEDLYVRDAFRGKGCRRPGPNALRRTELYSVPGRRYN